jgi:hypothetical protein
MRQDHGRNGGDMKIIKMVRPPCDCTDRLWKFYNEHKPQMQVGSVVECDCGKEWKLREDQRDGLYWS